MRIAGPTCTTHSCLRPVHEWGGYCAVCWMGFSAAQRAALHAVSAGPQPIDPLELWIQLPAFEGERPWAA